MKVSALVGSVGGLVAISYQLHASEMSRKRGSDETVVLSRRFLK